jgi:hypothetical protein
LQWVEEWSADSCEEKEEGKRDPGEGTVKWVLIRQIDTYLQVVGKTPTDGRGFPEEWRNGFFF